MAHLFRFEWGRSLGGYRLHETPVRTVDALTGEPGNSMLSVVAALNADLATYAPALDGDLHERLADVDDAGSALAFVEAHGFLTRVNVASESVAEILRHAKHLRAAVKAARGYTENVEWVGKITRTASSNFQSGARQRGPAPGLAETALSWLLNDFNGRAAKHASNFSIQLEPVSTATGRQRPSITVAPTNLVGAAWLSLAYEIAGAHSVKLCEVCGRPLSAGSRSNRRTCSDACKTKKSEMKRANRKEPKK